MMSAGEQECRVEEIFLCARCGYCCHGETTVSLDDNDQARMVQALGMTREEVARRFWRITGNVVQMQIVDGHCIFYKDGVGCTVHRGRPWRCGQWPLHPSILADRNNFETIRASCPGLNREMSYATFCQVLRAVLAGEDKPMF